MSAATVRTEIVPASEVEERILAPILELRKPGSMSEYKAELRKYKRRLGKREEGLITEKLKEPFASLTNGTKPRLGFIAELYDTKVAVYRPEPPRPTGYSRLHDDRFMGSATHAQDIGLLAEGGLYNRPIRQDRVNEYAEKMRVGEWHDLFSDPFAITADGQVLNGQHRIAAAERVDWSKVENVPSFLVLWNVSPDEAFYADGSKRTPRDQTIIFEKLHRNGQNDER